MGNLPGWGMRKNTILFLSELEAINPEYARLSYMIKKKREKEQPSTLSYSINCLNYQNVALENAGPLELCQCSTRDHRSANGNKTTGAKTISNKSRVKLEKCPKINAITD